MPRAKFHRDYDHRWPSGGITAFKAGHEGTVKREVLDAAKAKGRATQVPSRASHPHNDGRADSVVGDNPGPVDVSSPGGDRGSDLPDGNRDGASGDSSHTDSSAE